MRNINPVDHIYLSFISKWLNGSRKYNPKKQSLYWVLRVPSWIRLSFMYSLGIRVRVFNATFNNISVISSGGGQFYW